MKDGFSVNGMAQDSVSLFVTEQENGTGSGFKGEVFDTIYYADGRVEKREKSFNIIVKDFNRLITAFLKGETGYTTGNLYWAMGSGRTAWDTSAYTPVDTTDRLFTETYRKVIPAENRYFVTELGQRSETITNRLQLDIALESAEANGLSFREFGIFGGNASATVNSGILINHKVHPRIDKTEGMRIERSVRFTFN